MTPEQALKRALPVDRTWLVDRAKAAALDAAKNRVRNTGAFRSLGPGAQQDILDAIGGES